MGPDGLIDLIKTWRTAFPDGRMEIDALIVEGDTVAIRNTWYGTQNDEFYGIPRERQVRRGDVGRDRPRPGRPRHRGLGRARHGRDDAGSWARCPSSAPARSRPAATRRGAATANDGGADGSSEREPRDPDRASSAAIGDRGRRGGLRARRRRPVRRPQPRLGHERLRLGARRAAHAARRDAGPALRARHDLHGQRGQRGRPAHSVVRGTHTGEPLYGAEPSGNEIVWTHSDFVRLDGGKIVERWTATDMLTLFQQAGVLPSMGG